VCMCLCACAHPKSKIQNPKFSKILLLVPQHDTIGGNSFIAHLTCSVGAKTEVHKKYCTKLPLGYMPNIYMK
jgi:hypothetical protein